MTRIHDGWPYMTPWSATLLTLLGIAILLQSGRPNAVRVAAGRIAAACSGAVVVTFIVEYATGRSIGLDQALFPNAIAAAQISNPGRPSVESAVSILALAIAITILRLERRWVAPAWPITIAGAIALPTITLVTYLFDAADMLGGTVSFRMNAATAAAIVLLAAATVAVRPDRQPLAWLLAQHDRRMLVRLIVTFALVPIWVAIWRLVLLAAGLRGDMVWVLSVSLATLILGLPSFLIFRKIQISSADQLIQTRELARAEHQRAEAVQRYRILADNTVDVVVHLRAGSPAWVSPSIVGAFGWPAESWIGADFTPRIHYEDLPVVFAALAENAQGRPAVARFRIAAADGVHHWVEGRGKPYVDTSGSVDGVIVALRVIDAQIDAERELQAARDSAIALADAKSDYVATVSHEIRNPIQAIVGFSELLESRLSSAGRTEASEWANRVRTEAERLTRLIENLLDLSRLDAGRTRIAAEPFRLRELVDSVVEMSRLKAEAKGLALDYSIDPTISDWRIGDLDRLHQVLRNLITNAKKFTSHGRVDVEISPVTTESADLVRFAVIDTGPGIPGEELDRILQPFAQVRGSDSDQGSGLGLAISDRLVKALGGDGIKIASLEGHGSTFHFTIPLPPTQPREDRSDPGAEPGGHTAGRNILVVDDNVSNQVLVQAQLSRLGYRSEVASDGAAALERLDSEHFDAVLMDCSMPVMDGYEATRRIRTRERGTGRRLPVLALTASASGSNRDACERAGMDGFLSKPIRLAHLADAVARVLGDAPEPSRQRLSGDADSSRPDIPVIDDERVDRLLAELGPEPLQKVVSTFVDEMPRRVAELRRVAATRDTEAVRRSAHAIRSPSTMLGAAALAERLKSVEEATDPVAQVSEAGLDELIEASIDRLRAKLGQSAQQ